MQEIGIGTFSPEGAIKEAYKATLGDVRCAELDGDFGGPFCTVPPGQGGAEFEAVPPCLHQPPVHVVRPPTQPVGGLSPE